MSETITQNTEPQYLGMSEYMNEAYRYCNMFYVQNPTEDEIAKIMEYIMRADARWKPELGASRETFRYSYGSLACKSVRSYRRLYRNKMKRGKVPESLDFHFFNESNEGTIERSDLKTKEISAETKVIYDECIQKIETCKDLSDTEREILLRRFRDCETVKNIANAVGIKAAKLYGIIDRSCKKVRISYGKR